MSSFLQISLDVLKKEYPDLEALDKSKSLFFEGQLSQERLHPVLSEHIIDLPLSLYERIEKSIENISRYAQSDEHLKNLETYYEQKSQPLELEILRCKTKQRSVLMAYDFHYDSKNDRLALIEINTNASGFLLSDLVYRTHYESKRLAKENQSLFYKHSNPCELLWQSFRKEYSLFLKSKNDNSEPPPLKSIAIIDENVVQQKMYLEFLMFKSFFIKNKVDCEIFNFNELPKEKNFSLIYNRTTDFLLAGDAYANLRSAYLNGLLAFTPHPREYLLLADKMRLHDFYKKNLSPVLLEQFLVDENIDLHQLWNDRKKYFFKPQQSFGGKAVYRGASISRKMFENFFLQKTANSIAQEFCPPGVHKGFKYDLRFYVYESKIQLGVARLYQGQVTNFNTPGGGFAALHIA